MIENHLTMSGNLAGDVELKYSQAGKPYAVFTVMQSVRVKQGETWVDGPKNGLRVTCFGDLAEHVAESLVKGSRVVVSGRLEPQQWADAQTMQPRYGWAMAADDVAASLKFHTGQLTKAQQGGFQGGPSGRRANVTADPWAGSGQENQPPF